MVSDDLGPATYGGNERRSTYRYVVNDSRGTIVSDDLGPATYKDYEREIRRIHRKNPDI